ncbi:MAG: transcription antitermination factor NusB [Gammaproteobacteria bacterium]|nr:transcription antitermination factor NusB [Gammaproteobacteria bacterium]
MSNSSQKPSPAARRKARRFTVQALYQWQMTGANIGVIETQFRTDNDMCKTDVAYFHELLHEIPKCVNELDETFRPLLDREIKDLDRVELAILRIGTYELSKRPDVPFKVAINEGIELAKYFGATESHKYVNGILDKVAQRLRVQEMKANRDKPE